MRFDFRCDEGAAHGRCEVPISRQASKRPTVAALAIFLRGASLEGDRTQCRGRSNPRPSKRAERAVGPSRPDALRFTGSETGIK